MSGVADLYVCTALDVGVLAPVLVELQQRGVGAELIVEAPGTSLAQMAQGVRNPDGSVSRRLVDAIDAPAYRRIHDELARTGVSAIGKRRIGADVVLTTQHRAWFAPYEGRVARIAYGFGAVEHSYGHGSVNDGMDLVLAHGERSVTAIAAHRGTAAGVVPVGYPKWVPFRSWTPELAREALALDGDPRPTLVYLPTWSRWSSLEAVVPRLLSLTNQYRIVCKPHHNNLRFEAARLAALEAAGVEMLDTAGQLTPVLLAADVVLCDARSGALPEAMLAGRPTVAVRLPDDEVLPEFGEAVVFWNGSVALPDVLDDALSRPAAREARCAELVGEMFLDSQGRDAELAADALQALIRP